MVDLLNNELSDQINNLSHKAEEEELKYNWLKEIEILKKAEKISSEENFKLKNGEINFKLGEIYLMAANFGKTEENVIINFQLSKNHFLKSLEIFKDLNIEEKIYATLGFIDYLDYILETEAIEENILDRAKNEFKKAKLINFNKGDLIESLKSAIFESRFINLIMCEKLICIDPNIDFIELASDYENLVAKIWVDIKNQQQDLPEFYYYFFLKNIVHFVTLIFYFLPVKVSVKRQLLINNLNIISEFIDKIENSKKELSSFYAYSICSSFNMVYSIFYVESQFEQKKYLKSAQKWLRKAEILLPNITANSALRTFYFTRFTVSIFLIRLGFFARDFKHVMEDLNECVNLLFILFPRIFGIVITFLSVNVFLAAANNPSAPEVQRFDFAEKAMDLINSKINKFSLLNNPNYKLFTITKDVQLCMAFGILGDLSKNKEERDRYIKNSKTLFDNLSKFDNPFITDNYLYLTIVPRIGKTLASHSKEKNNKVYYDQKVIDILLRGREMAMAYFDVENQFLIGETYFEMATLTNDDKILKKAYSSYMNTIKFCKDKGYFNLVGTAYINLAQIEDRLENYLSASDNYKKAIDSFDQAIMTLTYTKLSKKIEKLKKYVEAWSIIEIAKSYHVKEEHHEAQLNYEQASRILNDLRDYKFESPFYSAWGVLEKAEDLSKINKHQEAAATYLVSKNKFHDALETLNSYLKKRKSLEDIDRISKLTQVAMIRETYCDARYEIETARIESRKGNHLIAAELYNKASVAFENICQKFKIRHERDELSAIYYLCKAWEKMEQAEGEQKPNLYDVASQLFEKASKIFPESRMKKLSIGNSLFCSALEQGSYFDKTTELDEKIKHYKKIKMYLRESSKNYQLGGFKQDAQWALATSTFFDGIWHLIQSDNEMNFSKRNEFLNIAINYLKNALQIFEKAGYEQKRDEILNYLEMIKDEKEILASALNIIEKPEISKSTVGISAPSCPIEISSSVNIEEMQETDMKTESELNWAKRIHHIYFLLPNGVCIYDQSFKKEKEIEPHLVTGSLAGISSLIQELTQNKTKIKIVEQEEMTILLEHGENLSVALITEENLITLQNKLTQLINDVEDFYQEELVAFSGDISVFSKIGKFIQKIFES